MIKNDRQYRISKAQAAKFTRAIAEVPSLAGKSVHPLLRKAQVAAMKSQLEDLRRDIEEYEGLRTRKKKVVRLSSLEELSKLLIQARIAAGLSQEELASKLGLKAQQIQRY